MKEIEQRTVQVASEQFDHTGLHSARFSQHSGKEGAIRQRSKSSVKCPGRMGERRCAPEGRAPRCGRCANGKHGFSGSYFTAHVALYAPSRNELPDFSSNIATARVAPHFRLTPTGVL